MHAGGNKRGGGGGIYDKQINRTVSTDAVYFLVRIDGALRQKEKGASRRPEVGLRMNVRMCDALRSLILNYL